MKLRILVADDDEVTRKLLKEVLEKSGYMVDLAASGEEALRMLQVSHFPIVLSDIKMLDVDGLEVLKTIKKSHPHSVVILMTGFGNMEGAIEAIQEGAFDYVSKPFKLEALKLIVSKAAMHWESACQSKDNSHEHLELTQTTLIGKSAQILAVYKTLARAAMASSTVLVIGESGSGKERVARVIHSNSQRRNRRFTVVNCGALTESLLETLCQESVGGTVFLDEVGDFNPALQIQLLGILENNQVRVIAATHRDLEALVIAGEFRDDLYYRLKVISIELPPLRDRMEDLPDLVDYFLARYSDQSHKRISHVSEEALALLRAYQWPGSIRELEHAIERAVAMTNTSVLFPEDFPSEIRRARFKERAGTSEQLSLGGSSSLEEIEKSHIIKVLQDVKFNKSKASEVLGIDRATLYRKAQKYRIELRDRT